MGNFYDHITPEQAKLIAQSRLFFVASVHPDLTGNAKGAGPVNLSPKGSALLHVINPNQVAYLDYSGSGNETARHIAAGGPITLMVCSFDENAATVRLYGRAKILPVDGSALAQQLLAAAPPDGERPLKTRQIIEVQVDRAVTSCGYGIPVMSYENERSKNERGLKYKQ